VTVGLPKKGESSDFSWTWPAMAQRRLKLVDRSTHERRQFQTHDRWQCGASSEVPSVGVLLPISGVAGSRRLQPSVGPSSTTQAQCGYSNEKQVRPVDTWCVLGLATNEGAGAMKRRGRTCASHSPNVLQRGVLTGVDLSDMLGPPLVWIQMLIYLCLNTYRHNVIF